MDEANAKQAFDIVGRAKEKACVLRSGSVSMSIGFHQPWSMRSAEPPFSSGRSSKAAAFAMFDPMVSARENGRRMLRKEAEGCPLRRNHDPDQASDQ